MRARGQRTESNIATALRVGKGVAVDSPKYWGEDVGKRKRQQEEAEAWVGLRNAEVSSATKFLFRLGERGVGSRYPRVLFVVGMQVDAGLTTFLDRIQPTGKSRIRVSCRDDDSRDPMYEALVGALWQLLITRHDVVTRFADAIYTYTSKQPDDLRRMIAVAGGEEAPHRFRCSLPDDFATLLKILLYVDATGEPWRLFVDEAFVKKAHRTLAGAMQFQHNANLEIAIGVRWTVEGVQLIDGWRRARPNDVGVVKLDRPRHRLSPRSGSDQFRTLFFPMVRSGNTASGQWNEQAVELIVKTTAALDGVAHENVEQLAALFHAQNNALEKLLSDYDLLLSEEGEYRAAPAWRNTVSSDDLVRFVEEALASGTGNPAAQWLLKIARHDSKRHHDDPLASARAVLLATAARYVRSNRDRNQEAAATSATLLARYLQENASAPSDRHFAILADLYRDSDNLSIIDYGLSLMPRRNGEPSFDEMRFFGAACRAARRYADQQISVEAAAQAASARLRPWVLPLELGLLTNALHSVWSRSKLERWLHSFVDRLTEFGLVPAVPSLRAQESRLEKGSPRGAWGRSTRKMVDAAKHVMKAGRRT